MRFFSQLNRLPINKNRAVSELILHTALFYVLLIILRINYLIVFNALVHNSKSLNIPSAFTLL